MNAEEPDPRIEQIVKLAHELMLERVQMAVEAAKDGNFERATVLFKDVETCRSALDSFLVGLE